MNEELKSFFEILDECDVYRRAIGKIQFDMECCAPEEGLARAADDMAVLAKHLFDLTHSDRYISLLLRLHTNRDELSAEQRRAVDCLFEDYSKTKNFSPEFSYEMDLVSNRAYGNWLKAKQENDFSLFRDSLADLVRYTHKALDLRDSLPGSYYDACLDDNEKGCSEAQLDIFFAALKRRIIPLLRRILCDGKPIRTDFLTRPCPISQQEAMSRRLLKLEGLRESALVLMTTEHPFTTNFGACDVRVTTHYYEENFISSIFSTLHEGGHALFMQNEPASFEENHCADRMTNGMHECISRFYENIVGRSEAFIELIMPAIYEITGDTFRDVSARELYEAVNVAAPGFLRTDADELTYCLHILIRYELEKAFINGSITVDEVPALWNEKYREYLGLEVPSDRLGCLQDVHWSGYALGYFPSYALGNAYGAQILHRMQQDFDLTEVIRSGELFRIRDWLKEHVFSIAGLMTPDEWLRSITGEPLNVNYYLDYLEQKFTALYDLH